MCINRTFFSSVSLPPRYQAFDIYHLYIHSIVIILKSICSVLYRVFIMVDLYCRSRLAILPVYSIDKSLFYLSVSIQLNLWSRSPIRFLFFQVRRKVTHTQQQHNLHESRSHCASEPRLNETETPPQRRRASQKRPTHTQSKSISEHRKRKKEKREKIKSFCWNFCSFFIGTTKLHYTFYHHHHHNQ